MAAALWFGLSSSAVYGVVAGNHIESFLPTNPMPYASFDIPSAVGVTYGDGDIYVSSGTTLTRYSTAGNVVTTTTLPPGCDIGALASAARTRAVREPSSWATVLLGFAGLGFAGCPRAGRKGVMGVNVALYS